MVTLPLQLTSFIGREQELAALACLLQESRLISLTGPGGCGKTRLALQVAQASTHHFAEVLCWVELDAIADASLLPQALITSIVPTTLRDQPGCSPLELIATYLRDKNCLLILDNCEHLVAACAGIVDSLLRACPNLHILTTTRERLDIAGERVWLVPSLSLPPQSALSGSRPTPNELVAFEAIRLFVERAVTHKHDFQFSEQNAAAVVQICRRLDGIPLAIELAAAKIPLLSASQIAGYLDNNFHLLASGHRSAIPRHRTLHTAIEWSYGLLTQEEQRVLQRLSVFRGTFSLEAVESICSDTPAESVNTPDVARNRAIEALANLVGKSLVVSQESNGVARYHLLETIRQFAGEKLAASQDQALILDRLLDWSISLAEGADAQIAGPDRAEWDARLNTEQDNFRAALEGSWPPSQSTQSTHAPGPTSPAQQEHQLILKTKHLRLAIALSSYWVLRGYGKEARLWFDRVLAHCHELPAEMQAHAVIMNGIISWGLSDFELAITQLEEGRKMVLALSGEHTYQQFLASNYLGFAYYYQDKYALATEYYEESLALMQKANLHAYIPFAYSLLGRVALRQGEYERARLFAEKSLLLSEQEKNVHSISATLNFLGTIECFQCNFEQATTLLGESLRLSRAIGIQQDIADTSIVIAMGAIAQREYAAAQEALEESLSIAREIGYRQGIAIAQGRLGEIACCRGDFDQAESLLCESLRYLQELGVRWHTLHILEVFALHSLAPAADAKRAKVAVKILGAVYAARLAVGAPRPPVEQWQYDATIALAKSRCGPSHFAGSWEEGLKMELGDAIRCALALKEEPPSHAIFIHKGIQKGLHGGIHKVDQQINEPILRIHALGPAEVYRGGALLTNADWGYAKPRELLYYLLCHPPRTREQIGFVLWPDASPTQLRSRIHAALHQLRQTLGNGEWILYANGRYSFNHQLASWFDLSQMESTIQEAQAALHGSQASAMQALAASLSHYRGDFLEEMEAYEWIVQRREEVRSLYLHALLKLGQWHFAGDQMAEAAQSFRRAIAHDPYFEPAHRELMCALTHLNAGAQAMRHYHTLVEMFQDELGVRPAPETVALVESLRSSNYH